MRGQASGGHIDTSLTPVPTPPKRPLAPAYRPRRGFDGENPRAAENVVERGEAPMRRITLVFAAVLGAALCTGCPTDPRELAEHSELRTFPAPAGKLVRLNLSSLDAEIEVAPAEVITVDVNLAVRAPTRAAAARWLARSQPTLEDSETVLEVRAPRRRVTFLLGSLRTDSQLRVIVPPTCRLEVASSSGDVRLEGGVDLAAPVRVTTVSGDVTVRGGVRSLDLRTVSGDLKVTAGTLEQLQLRSISGDATVEAPLRRVLADTTSGDLRLVGLVGDLSVHTTSGDLRAEYAPAGMPNAIRVDTTSGDVRLRLPSLSGLRGELRSRTGTVRTSAVGRWEKKDRHFVLVPTALQAPPVEAAPGRAAATVEVSTRSGDISLRPS